MIHLDVLEVLKEVYPESVTPGQIMGRLLEVHSMTTVSRDQVESTLNQLKDRGMARNNYGNEWVATA